MVTLIAGTGRLTDASFVGQSIAQVRAAYQGVFNIPAGAQAVVNGANQTDAYTLRAGDELVFSKPAGQKG